MSTSFQVNRVAVFGAGQFGFVIAKLLSDTNPELPIVMTDVVVEYVESIKKTRQHPLFHKGVTLGPKVSATLSAEEALQGANLIVVAVPGQLVRSCVQNITKYVKTDVVLLNVAKALENQTNELMHSVIEDEWRKGSKYHCYFSTLSGGMIADHVGIGAPLGAEIACSNITIAQHLKELFNTPNFKIKVTDDLVGVELAGAFKNVIAIGGGLFDGLGLPMSSKAAFISEASAELSQLALLLGGKAETFSLGSFAWIGDLLTTCFGSSRNRQFGELIGKGLTPEEAKTQMSGKRLSVEGYITTNAFYNLAKSRGIKTPILKTLYEVLFQGKSAKQAVQEFFQSTPTARL
eukprot:TRINITY_DN721_c3_g2_i1.p1 TRINITY_DN721_c3_g2~~TRINITY_DN721_c3_g2_i1.p1  ORF type:complete len:348 (+),score=90.72 TRINITY_DN721_c3_g2_i1:58-1101(+)